MADLGPAVGAVAEALGPLVMKLLGPALRALVSTFLGMLVLGLALAAGCYAIASPGSAARGGLAVLLAMGICLALGGLLAVKRAVGQALLGGIERFGLGQRAVGLLFNRLLPGGLTRAAERLPLAQAEQRLQEAIQAVPGIQAGGVRGWLAQRVQGRLVELVGQVTLSRFRTEGSAGVDLAKVRAELETQVSTALAERVRGGMTQITVILVLTAGTLSLLLAFALRHRA